MALLGVFRGGGCMLLLLGVLCGGVVSGMMLALGGGRGIEEEEGWVVLGLELVGEWRRGLGDGDIVREVAGRCRRVGWVWAFGFARGNAWLGGVCRDLWGGRSNPLF